MSAINIEQVWDNKTQAQKDFDRLSASLDRPHAIVHGLGIAALTTIGFLASHGDISTAATVASILTTVDTALHIPTTRLKHSTAKKLNGLQDTLDEYYYQQAQTNKAVIPPSTLPSNTYNAAWLEYEGYSPQPEYLNGERVIEVVWPIEIDDGSNRQPCYYVTERKPRDINEYHYDTDDDVHFPG